MKSCILCQAWHVHCFCIIWKWFIFKWTCSWSHVSFHSKLSIYIIHICGKLIYELSLLQVFMFKEQGYSNCDIPCIHRETSSHRKGSTFHSTITKFSLVPSQYYRHVSCPLYLTPNSGHDWTDVNSFSFVFNSKYYLC